MIILILIAACSIILTTLISLVINRRLNYFRKLDTPHECLNVLFGNAKKSALKKLSITYDIDRIYTKFKGSGLCVGFMNIFTPYLLPLDAELLRNILITNFKSFRNNDFGFATERHTIISLNPFWLSNEKWRMRRSELSTAITASRLKAMYPLIENAARDLRDYVRMRKTIDLMDVSERYSCNSMASITYGLDAHAYDEKASDILKNARKLSSPQIPPEVNQFFINLTSTSIKRRRYKNDQHNDLLNYVIKLKDKRNFSDIETAAQSMTFFHGGFTTSTLALCYVLYELSRNQKAQQKLRMEIIEAIPDSVSSIPIESLLNFRYLDQVLYEAIRLHPPLHYTTRVCNESIELISHSDQKVVVPNGSVMWIPIYSTHRDPDYYAHPNNFIPERFDGDGVKDFIDKCVLLPFGAGERICLGRDLAVVQIKAAVVELLRHFEMICCDSVMDGDVSIKPGEFLNVPNGRIRVRFKDL